MPLPLLLETDPPLAWDEAADLIAAQSGVVFLVGATDVGKSTLALEAANRAVRAGKHVAILDSDLGQGEVGPPGTMGLVRLETPVAALGELPPRALAFVGACSPNGHFLSVVEGVHQLVRHARDRGDELVIVDTSGLIAGRLAEKLKLAKLEVLRPCLVVALQRGSELQRLNALMQARTAAPVMRAQSPAGAGRKSPVYRRVQRAQRMRKHFESARIHDLDLASLRTLDGWLYTGTALPVATLRAAATALKTDVPHGEQTADGIYLCITGKPDRDGFTIFHDLFGKKRVTLTPAVTLSSLLVGLVGPEGRLIDVALLQGVNFERALFSLLTPARTLEDVRLLHFGRLRVRPDGSEITHLRPSDL